MLHFTKIGFERKSERHAAQLEKQRRMNEDAEKEFSANKLASDMKHELKIGLEINACICFFSIYTLLRLPPLFYRYEVCS